MEKTMFFEVVEAKFDSDKNPDQIEEVVGRFQRFVRASSFARDLYDKNKPENFTTILRNDYYGECIFIAEKPDNGKRIEQYMVEVRVVGFDDLKSMAKCSDSRFDC